MTVAVKKNRLIIITGYRFPSINLGLAFQKRGYELLFHKTIDEAAKLDAFPDTDAVLVHLPENNDAAVDVLNKMLANVMVPMVVSESPPLVGQALSQWVEEIEKKLHSEITGESKTAKSAFVAPTVSYVKPEKKKLAKVSARVVWVLGASFGGPDALRLFLRQLPVIPNLGLVIAQHIGPGFSHLLCDQLSRCTGYNVVPAKHSYKLFQGEIMVVPPDKLFSLDDDGKVCLKPAPNEHRYSPSISSVMLAAAEHYGRSSGTVLFSGMGDDGRDVCEKVVGLGAEIWAQSPASCISPSMPESAIKTGFVAKQGSPEFLAAELTNRLKEGSGYELSS